jgi:hypothetical protein
MLSVVYSNLQHPQHQQPFDDQVSAAIRSMHADNTQLTFPGYCAPFLEELDRCLQEKAKLSYLLAQGQTEAQYIIPPHGALSVRFATAFLDVSAHQLHAWVRKGWLHRWKVGKESYFSQAQIQAFRLMNGWCRRQQAMPLTKRLRKQSAAA